MRDRPQISGGLLNFHKSAVGFISEAFHFAGVFLFGLEGDEVDPAGLGSWKFLFNEFVQLIPGNGSHAVAGLLLEAPIGDEVDDVRFHFCGDIQHAGQTSRV